MTESYMFQKAALMLNIITPKSALLFLLSGVLLSSVSAIATENTELKPSKQEQSMNMINDRETLKYEKKFKTATFT